MFMSKRRIKGKEFIKDIKDGLTEEQLRGKYAISPQQLTKLLTQVVSQNLVSEEELRSRFFLEPVKQPTETEKAEVAREGAAGVDVASRTFLRDFSFLFKKGNIGEGRQITSQTLTKARNSFLACFLILVVTGQSFRLFLEIAFYLGILEEGQEWLISVAAGGTLGSKAVFIYLVFALSRFLGQPLWLTIFYCILTPFSVLYLIPFIGLLFGIRAKRRSLAP